MSSTPDFQLALRLAARRQKLRLVTRMAGKAVPMASGVAIMAIALVFTNSQLFAGPARLLLFLLAVTLIMLLTIPMFARFVPSQAAKALDRDLRLPDSALALVQLKTPGPWQDAMQNEILGRLQSARPITRNSDTKTLSLAVFLILTLLLGSAIWLPSLPRETRPVTEAADLAALDEVLEDWEAFAEKNANREGQEVKQAADALKEALQKRETGRSDLLVRIATVEDRLQTQLASAVSLESLLPSLAEALAAAADPSEAPRSGAPTASEVLDQMASQLPTDFPVANSSELEELARQLGDAGHTKLAEALRELAAAKTSAQAQSAIKKLSQSLSDAGALADARETMELAMMQLAAAREGTSGNPQGGLSLLPKLSDQGNPGVGAGDSAEFPESTTARDLDPASLLAPVNSTNQSDGEAMVQVLPSAEGLRETPSRGPSNEIATRGPLSGEAITTETLPLVHRGTVRKYFDAIRPKPQNP